MSRRRRRVANPRAREIAAKHRAPVPTSSGTGPADFLPPGIDDEPILSAFGRNDEEPEPEPEYGDFWLEPDEDDA